MGRIENSQPDPHIHNHLIYDQNDTVVHWKQINKQQQKKTRYWVSSIATWKKIYLDPYLTSHTQISSRWIDGGKGLDGAAQQASHRFPGWQGLAGLGPRVGQGAGVVGVGLGGASPLRPAWASALRRARRDLEGGESFTEQRPSASTSDSSASLFCSFSSC